MSDFPLRRLAHECPELRKRLVPLLRKTAQLEDLKELHDEAEAKLGSLLSLVEGDDMTPEAHAALGEFSGVLTRLSSKATLAKMALPGKRQDLKVYGDQVDKAEKRVKKDVSNKVGIRGTTQLRRRLESMGEDFKRLRRLIK